MADTWQCHVSIYVPTVLPATKNIKLIITRVLKARFTSIEVARSIQLGSFSVERCTCLLKESTSQCARALRGVEARLIRNTYTACCSFLFWACPPRPLKYTCNSRKQFKPSSSCLNFPYRYDGMHDSSIFLVKQ